MAAGGGGGSDLDIVQLAQSIPDLSILVEVLVAAGLVNTLKGRGPFTVFAPTDAAFEALPADVPLLIKVLTYQVLSGRVLKADVPVGAAITTVQGGMLVIDRSLAITAARGRRASIVATDVLTSNGVIHVVEKLILPTA